MPVRFRILGAGRAAAGDPPGAAIERVVDVADGHAAIRLGRRADLELPLPFATLSSVHARVLREGESFSLEDTSSTNGTSLDGLRLDPDERRALEPGAELRLADVRLRFEGPVSAAERAGSPTTAPPVEGTGTIARRLVGDLFGNAQTGVPTLVVTRGAPARRLALTELDRAYVVGRAETCALPLDVEEVSREHAAFVRDAAGVLVRDLGSKNGVVVGGARVAGERRLADGDVVEVGAVSLALEDPIERYLRELAEAPEPAPAAGASLAPAGSPSPSPPRPPRSARAPAVVAVGVLVLVGVAVVWLVVAG